MKAQIIILLLLATGCGTYKAYNVVGPDGQSNWVAISCKSQTQCMRLAGDACPHGYSNTEDIVKYGKYSRAMDIVIQCKGPAHKLCGGDLQTHGCQGTTRWNEDVLQCEPC